MQPQYVSTITTTTVSGPPSYDKLDQPPNYDEADLRVNIPGKQSIFSTIKERTWIGLTDLWCSTICLVLLRLRGNWQKWLRRRTRWWNISNQCSKQVRQQMTLPVAIIQPSKLVPLQLLFTMWSSFALKRELGYLQGDLHMNAY